MQNDGSPMPIRVSDGADSDTCAFGVRPYFGWAQIQIFDLNVNKSSKSKTNEYVSRWICIGEIVWWAFTFTTSRFNLALFCWFDVDRIMSNVLEFDCKQATNKFNNNNYLFNSLSMKSTRRVFGSRVRFVTALAKCDYIRYEWNIKFDSIVIVWMKWHSTFSS